MNRIRYKKEEEQRKRTEAVLEYKHFVFPLSCCL